MLCFPFIISLIMNGASIFLSLFTMLIYEPEGDTMCEKISNRKIILLKHIQNIIYNMVLLSLVYVLCKYKYEKAAWFVILLPIVISIVMLIIIINKLQNIKLCKLPIEINK